MNKERFDMVSRFDGEFRICDRGNDNNLLNMDEILDLLNELDYDRSVLEFMVVQMSELVNELGYGVKWEDGRMRVWLKQE